MSRKSLMMFMAGAMAVMTDPLSQVEINTTPPNIKPDTKEYIQRHRDGRKLREFSIKGHKIMAYSKKDAITRLKHQKKI